MAQAKVTINAVPGSNVTLPINTLVQLDNQNSGGELTFTWSILDQPPGAVDTLSSTAAQNPFFTPRKEGTYLIRLIVNQGLPTEQEDRVVVGIRQLKTLERIPAAGETTEADTSDGWATASNSYLRRIDALLSDPGVIIGVNASGGTLTRGQVLRCTAASIIKSGLPGQETVPGFSTAVASILAQVDELLVVMEGHVDGSNSAANGQLIKVRYIGRLAAITPGGTAAVGDTIYVNDTAALSLTQGTIRRRVGSAMSAGTTFDIWFNGVGGADIDLTPIDRRYLVYGSKGTLPNAFRVDGVTNGDLAVVGGDSFTIKTGDATTITMVLRRFSGAGLAIQQWQTEGGTVLAQVSNNGQLSLTQGLLVTGGGATILAGHLSMGAGQIVTWGGGFDVFQAGSNIGFVAGTGNGAAYLTGTPTQGVWVVQEPSIGGVLYLDVGPTESKVHDPVNGLPIWVGPNAAWNFDSTDHLLARGANTQRIQWPSLFNISSRIAGVSFGRDAVDFAELFNSALNTFSHLLVVGGGTSAILRASGSDVRVGSISAVPVDIHAGGIARWRVDNTTGALQGQGGVRLIENVADPVSVQDAATKSYVDLPKAQISALPISNLLINGGFDFWQRGLTINAVQGALGSVRKQAADRWAITAGRGTGVGNVEVIMSRQTNTGVWNNLVHPYVARFTVNQLPVAQWDITWAQEIDRDQVIRARGKKLILKWLATADANFDGQAVQVDLIAGTGAATENVFSGYSGSTVVQTYTLNFHTGTNVAQLFAAAVPANATTLALRFQMSNTINPSPPTVPAYVEFAELLLLDVDANAPGTVVAATPWGRAGASLHRELYLCKRFYEKSYEVDTPPGTNTYDAHFLTRMIAVGAIAAGGLVPLTSNPRFEVEKWRAGTALSLWTPEGVANNWTNGAANVPMFGDRDSSGIVGAGFNTKGFYLISTAGFTPTADYARGHWAADAEI